MATDQLQSEIARARRIAAMLSSKEDKARLEQYVADLVRTIDRAPRVPEPNRA